jgi:hypothetical protein
MTIRPVTTLQRLQGGRLEVASAFPPPQDAAQIVHDGVAPVEGMQRWMGLYATIAPHARENPMYVKRGQGEWQPVALGDYDGLEWLLIAARGNGTDAVVPVGMAMDGFAGICLDFNHTMGRNEAFGGPILALWTHNLWLGGEVGYNHAATHIGTRWNNTINLSAQDTATAGGRLGPLPATYEAARLRPKLVFTSEETVVREHLGLAADADVVRVTTARSRQRGWVSVVGLNVLALVRMLCRIDYTSSHDISYSTWVDATTAQHIVMDGCSAFAQWWRTTWHAWCNVTHLEVPDVANPQCLAPGDELSRTFATRRGQLKAWGLWWLYGGLHGALAEESTLRVSRPAVAEAANGGDSAAPGTSCQRAACVPHVTVCLTSREQVSQRRFVVIPGGAGYDKGDHLPTETQWRLDVPLTAANLVHYRTCMAALEAATDTQQRRRAMADLAAAIAVKLDEVRVSGTVYSTELGVRVGLLPSNLWANWMPAGFSWGLANHTSGSATQRSWTQAEGEGHRDFVQDVFVEQAQTLRGPDGERVADAIAIVERSRGSDGSAGGHVLCASHIRLSRADAAELSRYTVGPLASAYVGLSVADTDSGGAAVEATLRGAGWRVGRDVSFEQRITPAELRALLQEPPLATDAASVALANLLQRVPAEAGRDDATLLEQFAAHLPAYLKSTGILGLGTLYRALAKISDTTPPLLVRSTCDAYARPQALADLLTRRYHDLTADQVAPMRVAVREAQREIGSIADLIAADRFLDAEQKAQHLTALGAQRGRLDALYLKAPRAPLPAGAAAWLLAGQNALRRMNRQDETRDAERQRLTALIAQGHRLDLLNVSPCDALLMRLEQHMQVQL